ncbi:hypothetical protein INS49_010146 [Diaporthe citri]|uniref:uncharacterized protein n=1 Tax=Diaporthe citri TaxID=83186 RepID=UPI001C821EB3|nr:uncharacterized protein INS49_010146 [Diaporthe citri]KAG6361917.1 hypothetical protein INS49_010146 [Diaporthe citri]
MCIVLLTTAHPKYALIVIDNRDEFILRPTSRPHWWSTRASQQPSRTHTPDVSSQQTGVDGQPPNGDSEEIQHILSSRDLQRAERGTWLGITKSGHFSVLTNYRELDPSKLCQPISGQRSRGAMVTSWLENSAERSVGDYVEAVMASGGCQGVGGFSLICGKLRRRREGGEDGLEPMAILSNRAEHPDQIPWIVGKRGETVGLSNAAFDDPVEWPKVKNGKSLVNQVVSEAVEKDMNEDELRERLFWVLDQDTLPTHPGKSLEDHLTELKESVFIPLIGDSKHRDDMVRAASNGTDGANHADPEVQETLSKVVGAQRPDPQTTGFATGMYGTQRQTIILVDWDGNVTYTERALWDSNGSAIERGEGDMTFRFGVEAPDFDPDFNLDLDHNERPYPEQPAEITQVFYFLTFTLKEGIQQTVHALFQSLKCTYLLVSELHRPYLDSVRVLVPLWLAVIHAILLVFFVLAHRTAADAIQRLHESPPTSSRLPVSKSGRLSLGSHKSDLYLTQNPCCIYTEQPSAYWTGRFSSLHDKFLAECLTTNNLLSILDAQADSAKARNQQLQPHLLRETQYTRFNTRLPPSATSAAILQQTGGGGGPGSDTGGMHAADAELLLDDDERCKRVFVHLEAFCATDEARRSLFAFQQDYARKTRRVKLLPRGGTMGDRNWGSYISRMGVKRIGKRASMY